VQFLEINGYVIHYRWLDTGRARTFVFINSLGTDLRIWTQVAQSLESEGNILLFDNRGHGLSDVVPGTRGLIDFADDTEELLDRLDIQRCVLVGLSVGGMIAQVLASRIPERIEKLVLCDTRHKIGNEQIWNERIAVVEEDGFAGIADGVMQRWFSRLFREVNPAEVGGYRNMLERTPVAGYVQTCKAIRDADLTKIAREITLPVLCVVGAEDQSTPVEEVRSLAQLIPGSRFAVIPDSGHIPPVDNPEALAELIRQFVYS
jgi:3-oxoadipate enol-lactonase